MRISKEIFGVKGTLTAVHIKANGERVVLWTRPVKNLITFLGVAHVAGMLGDTTTYPKFTKGQIGDDNTPAADGNNGCISILSTDNVAFTRISTTITNDTGQFISTHTNAGPGAWSVTEYCLMSALGGTGLNRVVFAAIPIPALDSLEFTYKAQIQRA